MRHYIFIYKYTTCTDTFVYAMTQYNPHHHMLENYQTIETTLKMLHVSLVSVCWEITRTIQGIGSARVLFQSCPEL